MGKLFGTDGVRGRANIFPMDSETVLRLGRAAAHALRRSKGRHRILIGKDTRLSGYMLEQALASGITSMGVDLMFCGPLPTPGVAYMTRSMRADAGIMISASHNPYEDNGIKFFGADGFKLADETEAEIERLMQPGHLDELRAVPELIGKAVRIDDAVGRYTVYLKSCIERSCTLDGLRIVLDTANGAAYRVAPLVFSELGATLSQIGEKPDGTNINADCGSLYPERLCAKVKEERADLGIAFDGDADRIIVCDSAGRVFDGDQILALLALDFQAQGVLRGGGVVGTTMSNLGLEVRLREAGLAFHRSDVGDRYVLQEMLAKGINLGGEQSGHVISLDHNTTGDGILTALLLLNVLQRSQKPLSEYRDVFTRFPQLLINLRVRDKRPFSDLPAVCSVVKEAERELGSHGRVLLRYSGTEKKARVMVECDREDLCKTIAERVASVVREEIGE